MKKQNRRQFLKAGGLVAIGAIMPSLGCDRNQVEVSTDGGAAWEEAHITPSPCPMSG